MRNLLLGLGLAVAVPLVAPRGADAHVSVAVGLPGLGVLVGGPPVVYASPPPGYYAPPVYYRSYPRVVYGQPYSHDRGCHRGWHKHDWDEEDDD